MYCGGGGGGGWSKNIFRNSTRFGVRFTYINGTCRGTIFLVLAPWGPWEGPNGQISKNHNHNVNFKDFSAKLVRLLTNERCKTYQKGFSLGRLGHTPGVELGGTVGGWVVKKNFFPKFNQICCVSYLTQWHMQQHNCFGPYPMGP